MRSSCRLCLSVYPNFVVFRAVRVISKESRRFVLGDLVSCPPPPNVVSLTTSPTSFSFSLTPRTSCTVMNVWIPQIFPNLGWDEHENDIKYKLEN
jgi:hypothetical protein